jgi:hypothetical protein
MRKLLRIKTKKKKIILGGEIKFLSLSFCGLLNLPTISSPL